jgi:hypothetical protein
MYSREIMHSKKGCLYSYNSLSTLVAKIETEIALIEILIVFIDFSLIKFSD